MVANFSRNAGGSGGFMKIGGGTQSKSRRAQRESGFCRQGSMDAACYHCDEMGGQVFFRAASLAPLRADVGQICRHGGTARDGGL